MPIAIEALPPEEFAVWVKEQGGSMPADAVADAQAAEPATENEVAAEAG
jgi:cytochrome c oxidase subunit 2